MKVTRTARRANRHRRPPPQRFIFTLKSGNWFDPSVWSAVRCPVWRDQALVRRGHIVDLHYPEGNTSK